MKKKLENVEFSRAAGKSTLLQIDWKSWKTEQPKSGQDIWVVVRLTNGYYPVQGTYFDETFGASKDGHMPPARFRHVRFSSHQLPEIFLGSKDGKRLKAWGIQRGVVPLAKQCKKCNRVDCICK